MKADAIREKATPRCEWCWGGKYHHQTCPTLKRTCVGLTILVIMEKRYQARDEVARYDWLLSRVQELIDEPDYQI
jgi:hypothetical protein